MIRHNKYDSTEENVGVVNRIFLGVLSTSLQKHMFLLILLLSDFSNLYYSQVRK